MNLIRITILLTIIFSIQCNNKQLVIVEDKNITEKIICSLESNQDEYLIGDPIDIFLHIINETSETIYIDNSPYRGFTIEVKTENGEVLELHDGIDMRSGRYGITKIESQDKIKIHIHNIFKYRISQNSGKYTVTIDKKFLVHLDKKNPQSRSKTFQDFDKFVIASKREHIDILVSNNR